MAGVVVNANTQTGIGGATISVVSLPGRGTGMPHQARVTADQDGNWRLAGIACVSLQIAGFKPGFLPGSNSQSFITASANGSSGKLRLELIPESVVEGSVKDEQGKPVPAAEVRAVAVTAKNGHRVFIEGPGVIPDLKGNFRYGRLDERTYALCAASNPDDIPNAPSPWTGYSRSCMPDLGSDSSLKLAPGQSKRLDFVLHKIAGVHIRGAVEGLTAGAAAVVHLRRYDASTERIFRQDRPTTAQGTFEFTHIPPGDYYVSAALPSAAQPEQTAFAALHVESADIDHVQLKPAPSVALTGRIQYRLPGDVKSVASTIQLELRAASPAGPQAGTVQWDATRSSFTFPAVQPGTYQLSFLARDSFASGAMLDGKDILDQQVLITSPTEPIQITVEDNFGVTKGVVTDAEGKPVDGSLYFFRDGRRPIFGSTVGGGFTAALPPGEYRAIAFTDQTKVFYADPEWQAKHRSLWQKVTVRAGEVTPVSITRQPD